MIIIGFVWAIIESSVKCKIKGSLSSFYKLFTDKISTKESNFLKKRQRVGMAVRRGLQFYELIKRVDGLKDSDT